MRYFPIFVDLEAASVLVVGGGETAAQKVRLLARTPARLRIIAPALCAELAEAAEAGRIEWIGEAFAPDQLEGCRLAYAASDDDALDARVAAAARARNIPVNAVDRPEHCSFITPALVDRDPVVVAIGSEGAAPVLVRRIKAMLEARLPSRLGDLARFAGHLRERVAARWRDGASRRRFWEGFFDGPVARHVLAGEEARASDLIESQLDGPRRAVAAASPGSVTLVGAGPGDPDLLTFKAMRALQAADVIVTDRLVGPKILEAARRDAKRILVGKTPGGASTSQDEIGRILIREAMRGQKVVRLKGGDPLVFGRAAEELKALEAAGIAVEIVPGITAALATAARHGLTLTERRERRSLTLLTGHASDGPAEHDWQALARPGQALAVYMGVGAAGRMQARLAEAGIDPATPVTVVENATLPEEKVAVGRIDALAALVRDHGIKGPAIIVIGASPMLEAAPVEANPPVPLFAEEAAPPAALEPAPLGRAA